MVQSASKVLTVDEFITHYDECDRYKLKDEYQKRLFQNNDQLISSIFPNLQLTAQQIFTAGRSGIE